jgi:hypothetical protein
MNVPDCPGRFFLGFSKSTVAVAPNFCYQKRAERKRQLPPGSDQPPIVEVMMAGREPSISRRRVLGAAAAIPLLSLAPVRAEPIEAPADRELWDRNLARYQSLAARAKKAEETGWFRASNERFYRESADPDTDPKAAFARVTRAENLFWHRCTAPMQEAAVALVLTPAPDLEALRQKLAVILAHQLHKDRSMERDCIDVLDYDVKRIGSLF